MERPVDWERFHVKDLDMMKYTRTAFLLVGDMLLINLAYIVAFLLRFDFDVNGAVFTMHFGVFGSNMAAITLIHVFALMAFGIYTTLWRYASAREPVRVAFASAAGYVLVIAYMGLTQQTMPQSIYLISCMLLMLLITGSRFLYHFIYKLRTPGSFNSFVLRVGRKNIFGDNVEKVMVVGAGDVGASFIEQIQLQPNQYKKVVVAVDDDPRKKGFRIHGVKIAGDRTRIRHLARKYGVDEIIVTMSSEEHKTIKDILAECNKTRCKIKVLPGLLDSINDKGGVNKLHDVEIDDLLGRDAARVNVREIAGYIEGSIVLVTGAGGNIGSELCKQIMRFRPRRLIALDINANAIFALENELKNSYPQPEFEAVVASVCDQERMELIFERFKPHVVFHAAMHNQVALMEHNPGETVANNLLGTKILLDLAEQHIVRRFVMVSTGQANKPANVMGATKRLCEVMLQNRSEVSQTCYSAVRFGNMLSDSSVLISTFKKQIAAGGPVTVPHADMSKYFIALSEATQLVLQAGAMALGGEIFVLDMGAPIGLMDLARNLIKLSGYIPEEEIDIVVSGLRSGEKPHEESPLDDEMMEETTHDKIYIGHPIAAESEFRALLDDERDERFEEQVKRIALTEPTEIRTWLSNMLPAYKG